MPQGRSYIEIKHSEHSGCFCYTQIRRDTLTTTEMELISVDKLVPYVNNARTHSPEQIQKLRASLREFGFINPVIIDRECNVIAGHGRIMAAQAEGITEIPCVYADHLTEAQKKAYILADNRMALDAGWDEEMLRNEILALQEMNFIISQMSIAIGIEMPAYSKRPRNPVSAGRNRPISTPAAIHRATQTVRYLWNRLIPLFFCSIVSLHTYS